MQKTGQKMTMECRAHTRGGINTSRDYSLFILDRHKKKAKPPRVIGVSRVEEQWLSQAKIYFNAEIVPQYHLKGIGYLDGLIVDQKIALEFHGNFYHGKGYALNKTNGVNHKIMADLLLCTFDRDKRILESGYRLYRCWEEEYRIWRRRRDYSHQTCVDASNILPGQYITLEGVKAEIEHLVMMIQQEGINKDLFSKKGLSVLNKWLK